jgi:hypothetical protein
MFSSTLQNLLMQSQVEDLKRQAAATRSCCTAIDQAQRVRHDPGIRVRATANEGPSIRRLLRTTRSWPRSCPKGCW